MPFAGSMPIAVAASARDINIQICKSPVRNYESKPSGLDTETLKKIERGSI